MNDIIQNFKALDMAKLKTKETVNLKWVDVADYFEFERREISLIDLIERSSPTKMPGNIRIEVTVTAIQSSFGAS